MLTIAAPSSTTTSVTGFELAFSLDTRSSKQFTRLDFDPLRIWPSCEIAGGYAWFSYLKNSSKLPCLICEAMYNLENREQSFFREDTCSCPFDFSRAGGLLNNGRLFLLIGSNNGTVCSTRRSFTYKVYCCSPSFSISLTVFITPGSVRSRLSRTRRSLLVSLNGFPYLQKH